MAKWRNIPVKVGALEIGKVVLVEETAEGITVGMVFNDSPVAEFVKASLTDPVTQYSDMSFAFLPEPVISRGLWQELPSAPIDVGKMRANLEKVTEKDRIEAAMRYARSRYGNMRD